MTMLQQAQLPLLAGALMRLRGDTLSAVGTATGIRSANLSVWLRGKEQVISATRIAGLMYHLGVEAGRLRSDVLHRWHDAGPLDDVKKVLATLVGTGATVWLFQDKEPGFTKTRFLRAGDAWIKTELSSGLADMKDITDIVNAQRVLTLPTSLSAIPSDSLETVQEALLTMAEQVVLDAGDKDLLAGLMLRLVEMSTSAATKNTPEHRGWSQLHRALQSAIQRGMEPCDIARMIDDGIVRVRACGSQKAARS